MNWAREAEILNCQEEEKLHIAECSDTFSQKERNLLTPEEGLGNIYLSWLPCQVHPKSQVVPCLRGVTQNHSVVHVVADIRARLTATENLGKIDTSLTNAAFAIQAHGMLFFKRNMFQSKGIYR